MAHEMRAPLQRISGSRMKATTQFSAWRILFVVFAIAVSIPAGATPYTGSAPSCPATSGSTCSVDLRDFMKSKYSYTFNGVTYTFDGSSFTNSANTAATGAFVTASKYLHWNGSTYAQLAWLANTGFVAHPRF